jgi:4'-phosphopantetheinyl transferase
VRCSSRPASTSGACYSPIVPVATLPAKEVHLHLARPERLVDRALLARLGALLSPEEHERCAHFRHEHLRHAALLTRALVRTTLSRYADVHPSAWRFRPGTHGRPEIEGDAHGLSFNVAHTEGLIVCAIGRDRMLGVDVEHAAKRTEPMTLAEHFFAEDEVTSLRGLEGEPLRERFLAIWTLKEAYAKARGLGLSLSLDHYAFTFDDGGRARLWVDDAVRDDHAPWHFERRSLGPHRLALAVKLVDPGDARVLRLAEDSLVVGG